MRLAARGARDMDGGQEPVTNPEEGRLLRAQAARIYARSAVLALLLTGLGLLVAM
ncbi:MAG TPA: hypothetical protein VIE37_16080 [Methylomirabilota bacterium]